MLGTTSEIVLKMVQIINYPVTKQDKQQYIWEEMSRLYRLSLLKSWQLYEYFAEGDYTQTDDTSACVRKLQAVRQTSIGTTPKKRLNVFVMQILISRAGR